MYLFLIGSRAVCGLLDLVELPFWHLLNGEDKTTNCLGGAVLSGITADGEEASSKC
jgi:hypothetical protein